eukprot:scaffold21750_cov128-Isochrysis_galbana.AAC.4
MHAAGSPWAPISPGASLEPAVAALRGRFQTKALMSARTAKIKHLILESLYTFMIYTQSGTLICTATKPWLLRARACAYGAQARAGPGRYGDPYHVETCRRATC